MTASRRLAPLPLLLIGLAAIAALALLIPWVVQAQSQDVTPTAAATGTNPPAVPTTLQASAVHDSVTLTWTASTDQTVTHYAILRRNPDVDASQVFHVIESNAGPETSYTDGTVSASTAYIYRVKSVSPTGISRWSGYVKADTPAAPEPTPIPAPTAIPTPVPAPTPTPKALTGFTLVNATNQTALATFSEDAALELDDPENGSFGVRVETGAGVDIGSVRLELSGQKTETRTENWAPYSLYGDDGSSLHGSSLPAGSYTLRATAYASAGLQGDVLGTLAVSFTVTAAATPTPEPESTSDDQAPTGLTAALAEGGGVALTWIAPAEDADSVTGYEILRAVGEGDSTTLVSNTGSTATAYTDATATAAGETYVYQVKAIRGEERSQASGRAQVQVPHDPADLKPTGLTVELVENKVTLSWTAPAKDAGSVTGYEILRRRPYEGETLLATLVADTESTATTYTDATANEAGVQYVYRVKALRGSDVSLWSNFDRIELPADYVPESTSDDQAPTGLTAALAEGGGVALTWTAPAEDADSVTGYEILRAVGEREMATLAADTASTATTYTDATATEAGETYAYQVKAIRGEDRSEASGQAQVQIPHDPVDLAPTNLTALILTAPVVGEEDSVTRVGLTWSAPAEDADTITGYEILRAVGQGEFTTLVDDTGSTATFYTDATATEAGETYAYQVKAIRGEDLSGASGQAKVQIPHEPDDQAPGGLEVSMVRNRLTLSWTAPAADAESVTGYEILRGEGEVEPTTLVADTESTSTTYRDETATQAGVTYTYAVKALRGDDASAESNRVSYTLPSDYTASTKELASKVFTQFVVTGETLEFAPQVVVQPDQEPFTIWSGQLNLGFNRAFSPPTNGSLVPNTFTYNGVDYTITGLGIEEDYISSTSAYEYHLFFEISPPIGNENIAAWKFVSADGEFAFADAIVEYFDNGQEEQFNWPNSGLSAWFPRAGTPFPVSITGLPGTGGPEPVVDTTPGIKLRWNTRTSLGFGEFSSIPTKVGFTIHRSQRNPWGNFGFGGRQVGEVLKCDIAESGGAQSCLTIGTVGAFVSESWTWTDETAQRGVSYLYTIKPYYEFYSTNGTSVWNGDIRDRISSVLAASAGRVRIYGRASNVSHRMPHPDAPGTPPNLTASQPNSGACTGSCVRLTWDAAPNATKYVVFRTGQRTGETWVDYGLTYPQRFNPVDLTATEWEDTSAERGVRYTYRVAAFNEDGLRNATDAAIAFETPGGATVPNRVRDLSAEATRTNATSAAVTLEWTAPEDLSSVTGAKYEVQYRLDIPQKAEWDDDWKTLSSNVAATATSYTHTVALEKYYARGGTTEPFEFVPTADKRTLRLHDSDTTNDLILPFGINYEYRVRAVKGANKGLPADTTVRIPNQDGLQSVVIIEFVTDPGCAMWKHTTDVHGNAPDGYRVLFASATRRFHQANVVRDHLPYLDGQAPEGVPDCFFPPGYESDEWQGYPLAQRIPGTEPTYWIAVQAYDDDGIAKGDGTGGRRSRGSAEIIKWDDNTRDEHVPPAGGSEAESVGSGDDSE